MTNKTRRHALIIGAVLASLGVQVQTVRADDRISVRVRVENAAGVLGGILVGAQADATRIYRDAGIEIVWLNRDDREWGDGGRVIRVVLPSLKNADQYLHLEHVDKRALAEASAGASLIHIFWDRLRIAASHHGRDEAGLLGVVFAHEIGHVLLPSAGHSPTGIMQASVEVRMMAPLRFTPQQGEEMRNRLRPEFDVERHGGVALAAAVSN